MLAIRIIAAGLLAAAGVSIAVWLHGYDETRHIAAGTPAPGGGFFEARVYRVHPSWADPLAAGQLVASLALAAALIVARRR